MEHSLRQSLYKFIRYTFIVGAVLVSYIVLIEVSPVNSIAKSILFKYIEIDDKTPKVLFIGSSRVECSINPGLLKKHLPEYNFYNLGLPNSSILYNYQLAEKLIPIIPSGSIIFIELSDLSMIQPGNFFYFCSYRDLYSLTKKKLSLNFELNDIEKIFFSFFNIRSHVKLLAYPQKSILRELGFLKRDGFFVGNNGAFINAKDLNQSKGSLTAIQENYLAMLDSLVKKGHGRDIKIVFIPSLTIRKASERNQVLPIFNAIQRSDKWTYSTAFLEKITNTKYLYDLNHLNKSGAELYTLELVNEIKKIKE